VLDFGLAKLVGRLGSDSGEATEASPTRAGQVLGTVGYMSPEQVRGLPVDHRTDLFSLGVVLYELLSGKHPFRRATTVGTLTAILEETPAELSTLGRGVPPALSGIVGRCLEKDRGQRFRSAHDLALSLEAVLQAPAGAASLQEVEERSPYPGLMSFREKDAAFFFGREQEAVALWERLRSRHLWGVIGPSGAGKTSFVRAGVVATRPEGWGALVCTPGVAPFRGLGQALVSQLAGDVEALERILSVDDAAVAFDLVSRWRQGKGEALVVVDQFEELFTLNPKEVQERFAGLLGRLAREGGVHVLLSLRDDFLMRCADHESLAKVFESLSPIPALSRDGLVRALEEPAKKRGYRFEDKALVEEMVESVEGARGALPLLAFAVSRLWEKRDRERKLLTRAAYEEIGGVAGALAQHAEAALDRIGSPREPIVREIFRNLVTSHGTRAVAEREELLSLFPERKTAEEVLRELVDARLLTSYELASTDAVAGAEPAGGSASGAGADAQKRERHHIEIVHESLLKAWPRLVRWQTQDEEGARLRDQLRQAAHLWEEKSRSPDLLWTGTAFQEFELWRGRYPGALTRLEEDFARAMADKARRKRRLVRAAAVAVVLVSTGVAIAIAVSRHKAVVAAERAEASKLLALAQLKLQDDPTEGLAFAIASLELADTKEARVMALRALQEAPPAWEVPSGISDAKIPAFSPDGRHLAVAGHSADVGVWDESGGPPVRLPDHETSPRGGNVAAWASTEMLVTGLSGRTGQQVHVWSLPGGTKLRTIDFGTPSFWQVGPSRLFAETPEGTPAQPFVGGGLLRTWRLPDGEPEVLGRVDGTKLGISSSAFEPHGRGWLYTKGAITHFVPLPVDLGADRIFSRHAANVGFSGSLGPDLLALHEETGDNRLLRFPEDGPPVTTVVPKPGSAPAGVFPESSTRWVRGVPSEDAKLRLWDTKVLPGARPLELRREGSWYMAVPAFDPSGRIAVATTHNVSRLSFWPLPACWPSVVDGYDMIWRPLAFSPDGKWLATSWADGRLRLWPLPGTGSTGVKILGAPSVLWASVAFDPGGRYLFAVGLADNAWIVPLDGSPGRKLDEYSKDTFLRGATVSPTGRRVATAFCCGKGPKTLRVWDVETGAVRLFDLPVPSPPAGSAPRAPTGYEGGIRNLAFADDSTLYTAGHGGIRRWNLATGAHTLVRDDGPGALCGMAMSEDGRVVFTKKARFGGWQECSPLERFDVITGVSTQLTQFGDCPSGPPTQMAGSVLAIGSSDGIVRVARDSDREAHLLLGHVGVSGFAAISPDQRWVASTGDDNTLRLWPMPDLDKPPLQALPRDVLVAKLKSLTNLRAVRDPKSATGWSIELGPFPGWKNLPTW
jgi:WD40 repeat protein